MKKIILAAVAASVAMVPAVPAAAAPFGHNDRGRYEQVQHGKQNYRSAYERQALKSRYVQGRKWSKGQRFDRSYVRNYRIVDNPRAYRLHDAPRGYRWVRSDNDAVLVAITSGLIGAVFANIF